MITWDATTKDVNRVSRHTLTGSYRFIECVCLREPLRQQGRFILWSVQAFCFKGSLYVL